ncbi:MAG: NUDIX hydrolase [Desulforhopalus sp.]|nr:NUDIX hydrolase [Desulforhopalus sp.]
MARERNEPAGPMPWATGEEKTIASTRVFELRAASVHSPRTGLDREFYKLAVGPWVNVVALTSGGELILIRQYRFGSGLVEIEIPGGAVDPGENPLEAGIRELREETGYGGGQAQLLGWVRPNPAIQDNICSTILVEPVAKLGEPRFEEMEEIELFTVPVDEALAMIASGKIRHGLVLNALMFYAMHRGLTLSPLTKPA